MQKNRYLILPVVDGDGRYTGVFDMWDLLALLLPKAATVDDLVPNLSFLSDDLPALQQRMKESAASRWARWRGPTCPCCVRTCRRSRRCCCSIATEARCPWSMRPSGKLVGVLSYWDALVGNFGQEIVMKSRGGVWFGWDPFWVSTAILIVTYGGHHQRAGQPRHRRPARRRT